MNANAKSRVEPFHRVAVVRSLIRDRSVEGRGGIQINHAIGDKPPRPGRRRHGDGPIVRRCLGVPGSSVPGVESFLGVIVPRRRGDIRAPSVGVVVERAILTWVGWARV